jgi:isoleucyl-tRNA synthetase
MLGNIDDYDNKKNSPKELEEIDCLILDKLDNLLKESKENYDNFDFNKIISSILNFFIVDLSQFYFNHSKDVLYIHNKNSPRRRQIQKVIYEILNTSLILLAPILPTTIEEAYDEFKKENKLSSVHLEEFGNIKLDYKKPNLDK